MEVKEFYVIIYITSHLEKMDSTNTARYHNTVIIKYSLMYIPLRNATKTQMKHIYYQQFWYHVQTIYVE